MYCWDQRGQLRNICVIFFLSFRSLIGSDVPLLERCLVAGQLLELPFPLPPDSPVSALLELSGDYLHHVGEGSSLKTTCDETDEGIVSDQSFEYEDATATNTMRTKVRCGGL